MNRSDRTYYSPQGIVGGENAPLSLEMLRVNQGPQEIGAVVNMAGAELNAGNRVAAGTDQLFKNMQVNLDQANQQINLLKQQKQQLEERIRILEIEKIDLAAAHQSQMAAKAQNISSQMSAIYPMSNKAVEILEKIPPCAKYVRYRDALAQGDGLVEGEGSLSAIVSNLSNQLGPEYRPQGGVTVEQATRNLSNQVRAQVQSINNHIQTLQCSLK
jgi:hypothetical protein